MSVSAVNSNTTATSSQTTTGTGNPSSLINSDFQTFLLMLTTQMQNQDPLNPIESSDFAVQLATFSGVEQQVQTNQLLEGLISRVGLMNMADLAGWVGMEAKAPAATWYDGETPIALDFKGAADADQLVVATYDASGTLVAQSQLPATTTSLTWSGTSTDGSALPQGNYRFSLLNYTDGTLASSSTIETYGKVIEARNSDDGVILLREGGTEVAAANVTSIRSPTQ